jgi:N utilization substance protein A
MLLQTIEQIGREKNIAPEIIIAAIEEAMAVAAQKFYRTEDYVEAQLNPETGEVELYAVKNVVEEVEDPLSEITVEGALEEGMEDAQVGAQMRTSMATDQLGRIAAQAAKQVLYQKVRDAERDNIHAEYSDRIGELLTGTVKRFERGDMIVDLGRAEALLPRREQSRAEHYNISDRIRVVIVEVLHATRGPQIVVSRSSPLLLLRLFEMEVPEIYDGTVTIKGAVREGGDRAKVAVYSKDADVDPVGACVGMRGSRVQAIIRELRGEKIDIVEWAEDPDQYAINSLKPARVSRVGELVVVSEHGQEEHHLEVIVDEDQLSLAIGKRGQNVRLAGKLLGRKIDVKSHEQKRQEMAPPVAEPSVSADIATGTSASSAEELRQISGVGPKAAEALLAAGFKGAADIVDADMEVLIAVDGIGPKTAAKIQQAASASLSVEPVAAEPAATPELEIALDALQPEPV